MNTAFGTAVNTGMAWLDMMLKFQRQMQAASLQTLSSYSPTSDTRITGRLPQTTAATQVIKVGEERLNVATQTVQGETTRVRRRVVSQPVEQQVTLREETVIVERRTPTGSDPKPDVLTETVIEMSDSRQVPTVWKSLHVAEEVVLRLQVTERTEKVRDTVRRDVVDVEQAPEHRRDLVVVQQAPEHRRDVVAAAHDTTVGEVLAARTAAEMDRRAHEEAHDKAHDKKHAAPVVAPAATAAVAVTPAQPPRKG